MKVLTGDHCPKNLDMCLLQDMPAMKMETKSGAIAGIFLHRKVSAEFGCYGGFSVLTRGGLICVSPNRSTSEDMTVFQAFSLLPERIVVSTFQRRTLRLLHQ